MISSLIKQFASRSPLLGQNIASLRVGGVSNAPKWTVIQVQRVSFGGLSVVKKAGKVGVLVCLSVL